MAKNTQIRFSRFLYVLSLANGVEVNISESKFRTVIFPVRFQEMQKTHKYASAVFYTFYP